MRRYTFIFILLLMASLSVSSQTEKLDSIIGSGFSQTEKLDSISGSVSSQTEKPDSIIGSGFSQMEEADSISGSVSVQSEEADSLFLMEIDSLIIHYEEMERRKKVENVIKSFNERRLEREMKFSMDGSLHLVRGLLLLWTDHNFMMRDAYFEKKSNTFKWTDYAVGGIPLLANWALKAAGVQSRSKIERMLSANAMALGVSFGAAELLKLSVREGRPDQSDKNSLPSAHTSFAFVSATVLSREYGHLSPWVTIGSYTTAASTELLRIKHNKHWMSDLYMGAGIGVMSTNLAYFLTDKIFGADAINKPELRKRDVERLIKFGSRPSGFTFVSGTEIGDRTIRFDDARIKSGAAFSAGADLSWFISPLWAAELMTRVVDVQAKVFDTDHPFSGGHLDLYHFDLGAKFSYPYILGKRFATHVFAGVRMMDGDKFTDGTKTYTVPDEARFEFGAGLTYECLDTQNYAWGFNIDYFHTCSHYMKNRYSISSTWKILF